VIASRATCALALAAGLAAAAAGCSIKNPDFCCSSLDSCRAAGLDAVVACSDPTQPFCDDDGQYGAARSCVMDPGSQGCTGPDDCATAALPRCDVENSETCVGCAGDEDCARFAATPHCDGGSGACVACVTAAECTPAAPVCGADHTCRSCVADGECAAGVCALSGTCPAADDIVYLDAGAPISNVVCTAAEPCPTFALGLAVVTPARHHVKLAGGTYSEQVILDGKTIEVAGTGAEMSSFGNQVFDLRNGASLAVRGLRVEGATGRAVNCASSTLTLRDVELAQNFNVAVETSDCTVDLERARITGNHFGGLSLRGGRATVRNSFIGKNGSADTTVGGLYVMAPAAFTFEFNTVADNTVGAAGGTAQGLTCIALTPVTVANNVIVGEGANQVDAMSCAPTYTLSTEAVAGTGNLVGRPSFRNAAAGDYHLVAGSLGIDGADPAATLATDIDGEPRPNGGRSDIGADELR
jgi:hypothetical protein